jgi:hypothetical protein
VERDLAAILRAPSLIAVFRFIWSEAKLPRADAHVLPPGHWVDPWPPTLFFRAGFCFLDTRVLKFLCHTSSYRAVIALTAAFGNGQLKFRVLIVLGSVAISGETPSIAGTRSISARFPWRAAATRNRVNPGARGPKTFRAASPPGSEPSVRRRRRVI